MAAIIGLSLLFQWFGITAIQATTYAQVLSIALLFLLVALPVLGRRKPLEIICVAVGTTGILVLAFGGFFQILLP